MSINSSSAIASRIPQSVAAMLFFGAPIAADGQPPFIATDRPASPWRVAAPMHVPREYPLLAVLPDGRVLALGGHHLPPGRTLIHSAEIYDPRTDRWTLTEPLHVPREGASGVALRGGGYLLTGGDSNDGPLRATELFDLSTGKWAATGRLTVAGNRGPAVLLRDGRVLVAGGIDWATEKVLADAEIYDPVSAKWQPTRTMTTPRMGHAAAMLPTGQVLIVGGLAQYPSNDVLGTAELYDPAQGTWSRTGSMHQARRAVRLVLLDSGRILAIGGVAGGFSGEGDLDTAETYDPRTGRWTPTGTMAVARRNFPAARLGDGRVLVCGGAAGRRPEYRGAEIYDPSTGRWTAAGEMNLARRGHGAVLLADGRVLVVGGYQMSGAGFLKDVELFDPAALE